MKNTKAKNLTTYRSAVTLVAPFLLSLAISQSLAAQTSYTVTDIGPLNDINNEVAPGAACINNAGMVVGQALLPAGPDRPFLWIKGNIFDLGTFGGPNGGARGINARGEVVGTADTAAVPEQEHAFLWKDGVMHDLGTLGGDSSVANSINNRGWTAGAADTTIIKNRYSALIAGSSGLERLLRSLDIDTLLIAGTKTNICCEATARDAMMLDFKVVMVSDCCAALSDDEHRAALENMIQQFGDVMTGKEVLERLRRQSNR